MSRLRFMRALANGPPWGLTGMFALILLAEGLIARHAVDLTHPATWSWRTAGLAARQYTPGAEVLCFGDSLVKMGVLPAVLEEKLGARAYNLAICGASAPASYFLLRRALAAGARPSAAIVDYVPGLLAGSQRHFDRHWPELLSLRECIELSWTAHDVRFFTTSMLAIVFPSIRARHDLRAYVRLALQGKGQETGLTAAQFAQHWRRQRGAQVSSPNSNFNGFVDASMLKALLAHVFWCDRVNERYIRKFLTLAGQQRITVFWLLPPLAPVLQRARDRTGADTAHVAFISRMQAEFSNLIVVDGRHSSYDHTLFIDPQHLDRRGACGLSTELAAIVQRYGRGAAGARAWVTLPPYRAHETRVALEEIDHAKLAAAGRQLR